MLCTQWRAVQIYFRAQVASRSPSFQNFMLDTPTSREMLESQTSVSFKNGTHRKGLYLNENLSEFWDVQVHACSVAQSCPILCDPMGCSTPGSSVRGIFQARILECVAISFPKGSSWPMDWTWVFSISCIDRWILYHWATWESLQYSNQNLSAGFC